MNSFKLNIKVNKNAYTLRSQIMYNNIIFLYYIKVFESCSCIADVRFTLFEFLGHVLLVFIEGKMAK